MCRVILVAVLSAYPAQRPNEARHAVKKISCNLAEPGLLPGRPDFQRRDFEWR